MKIKNTSKAIQGVWSTDAELVHVKPGETVDIEPVNPERVLAAVFFEVEYDPNPKPVAPSEPPKRGPGRPPKVAE